MGKHRSKEDSVILFGRRLKALREAANISQEQIQFATGISQSQIARIESGDLNTGISHVSRLANFFGLEDFQLFQYSEPVPDSEELRKNISKFLKTQSIDSSTFLRKSIVYYLESKVLESKFLHTPRLAIEIAKYLEEKYDAEFTTMSLSQALNRFVKKGRIERVLTDKKSKYRYRKL